MKRKGIALTLSVTLLSLSAYITAFAATDTLNNEIATCYQSPVAAYSGFDIGEPVDESLTARARAATITVNVVSPCDYEFISRYPDWYNQAYHAVERADDGPYALYGLDYVPVAQVYWPGTGYTMIDLLNSAMNQSGLAYNSYQRADVMVAFTGKTVDPGVLGIAYMGAPYALVKDGGFAQNAACAQHEIGHTYGCSHEGALWDNDSACIMYRYLVPGNIDRYCASHNTVMNTNKYRY